MIITVILLVILATVTINAVFDSGIIWQASNGTQNYISAEKTENSIINNTASIMQEYINGNTSSSSSTESGDTGGGTGGTTQDTTAPSAGLTVTGYTANSITVTATGEDAESGIKSYTFEISESDTFSNATTTTYTTDETSCVETFPGLTPKQTYYIRVTVTNNVDLTATETVSQTPVYTLGSYIDYKPVTGTFDSSETYNGYGDQSFTTLSTLNWRILFIDDDTLTLISDTTANTAFYLKSYNGYNNGVKLLNDACEAMYSNSSLGATARNLNVDDIQSVSSYDEATYSNYGTEYTPTYKYYPAIFAKETNGYVNTAYGDTYTRSQQDDYITGYSEASTLIGKYTYFTYTLSATYLDSIYLELFRYEPNTTTNLGKYWLASRCINYNSSSSYIYYEILSVNDSTINPISLYNSYEELPFGWNYAIRPVVEIDLSQASIGLTGSGTSEDPYSITAK